MTIVWHSEASKELADAALWYENQERGLGEYFLSSFERDFAELASDPEQFRIYHEPCRRKLVQGFPYSIIYRFTWPKLQVIAIMHHRRKPGYWAERV